MKVGDLVLNSWAGQSITPVEIIRETAKRLEICALERTRLAGRNRFLAAGQTTLVPRDAIQNIRKVHDR